MKSVKKAKELYLKYERHISSIGLVGGFVFDALTLKRVDLPLENFWIVLHLVGAALGIFFLNFFEKKKGADITKFTEREKDTHFLLLFITQFMFGGLLSTFIVFYFRSATLSTSWPFMVLLLAAFAANERLRDQYQRMSFQISMLFVSVYAFAIFLIPVIAHQIGPWVFIASGVVSLAALGAYLFILWYFVRDRLRASWTLIFWLVGGMTALINIFYFTNLIPPIPLSVKDAGVYHSIERMAGNYVLIGENVSSKSVFSKVRDYVRLYEIYHQSPGQVVYVYSAVFSPTAFNTKVIHNWQYYDEGLKRWVSKSRINLPIVGGRDGGYRTYSSQVNLEEGKWRVDVETPQGQDIGRVRFIVENVTN